MSDMPIFRQLTIFHQESVPSVSGTMKLFAALLTNKAVRRYTK